MYLYICTVSNNPTTPWCRKRMFLPYCIPQISSTDLTSRLISAFRRPFADAVGYVRCIGHSGASEARRSVIKRGGGLMGSTWWSCSSSRHYSLTPVM
jgi:hypothetical protein